MMQLNQCLLESNTSLLRAVASYISVDTGGNPSRAEVIACLMQHLPDRERFQALFGRLSSWEHEIVYQVRDAGGGIDAADLEKAWGNDDTELDRRWFWHETVARGLARLRLSGILFLVRAENDSGKEYILPGQYHDWVPDPPLRIQSTDYAPYKYASVDFAILSDMYHFMQYLDEFRVRPLRNGRLPKRHLRQIIKRLDDLTPVPYPRDMAYVELLQSLANAMGFILIRKGLISARRTMDVWLERSQPQQVYDLYTAWLNMDDQIDLKTICGMTVESAGLRHPPRRVKRAVVGVIARLPDHWVTITDISRHFQRHRPFFYRPDHSPGLWRLVNPATREPVPAPTIWNCLEYRVLRFILSGALGSLGLLSVGVDDRNEIESIYLTNLGRAILEGRPETVVAQAPEPSPLNKVIVQPDFDILAPAAMVLSIRDTLDRIAERVSGGHMQRYRLTRDSVARAMESGMQPGDIVRFLESTSRDTLPGNVRTSVCDWIEEFGKIELQPHILLTTRDEYLMQEILARPAVGRFIRRQVGPSTAVVDAMDVESLAAELKRMGYLPKIHESSNESGEVASFSLEIDLKSLELLYSMVTTMIENPLEQMSKDDITVLDNLIRRLGDLLGRQ